MTDIDTYEATARRLYDILTDTSAAPTTRAAAADQMADYLGSGGTAPYGLSWRHVSRITLDVLDRGGAATL